MKKIEESRSEYIPTVSLYYEDLADLLALFKECSEKTVLVSNKHEFESLEEMKGFCGENVEALEITAGDYSQVRLRFGRKMFPGGTHLYVSGGRDAVFLRIGERLERNKTFLVTFLPKVTWGWFIVISILLWGFEPFLISKMGAISSLALVFLYYLICGASFLFHTGHFYSIALVKKAETRSFWARNKDQLLVALLSGVVGAVAGAIMTFLVTKK